MTFSSERVKSLPPYLFSVFQKKKKELQAKGIEVIDLGIGAPDLPAPKFVIDRLSEEAKKPENHRYSPYGGCQEFKQAVATFYKKQYKVTLDPETEILTLIGSKEGIAHLIHAVINPGDGVLLPDPGYPVYQSAVHLAHGVSVPLPLDEKRGYVPSFGEVSNAEWDQAKLMLLNYPNNPTGATVELDTFEKTMDIAQKKRVCVAHDAAYDLVCFEDYQAPSLLQVQGAKEWAVEFGSLSKSFNMTGWRIGYVVGNKELIRALSIVKSNTDTSQFLAVQKAGAAALNSDFSCVKENNAIYQSRRNFMLSALRRMGMEAAKPRGTFFIWAQVPEGYTSRVFSEKMLDQAGVIVTPGTAFGSKGEGYIRISLSVPTERLKVAIGRMERLMSGGTLL